MDSNSMSLAWPSGSFSKMVCASVSRRGIYQKDRTLLILAGPPLFNSFQRNRGEEYRALPWEISS